MSSCFIFPKQISDEQWCCLRLDAKGQVEMPLAMRSKSELQEMQVNARTMIVLSSAHASLLTLDLPWLSDKKARAAIPYALEEQLAAPVETLHFAFDKHHHQLQRYLVAVLDKVYLKAWIERLNAEYLHFDLITLDWFSLLDNEVCVTEEGLLVRDNALKGALNEALATRYLSEKALGSALLVFHDSLSALTSKEATGVDLPCKVWMAQRLLKTHPMNLCQGALRNDTRQTSCLHWYRALIVLVSLWVISALVLKGVALHKTTQETARYDKKIAVLYREFFPKAQQIISPQFRIAQLMKGDPSGSVVLWSLLDKLASAYLGTPFKIQHLRFQNQRLSVALESKDFATLEKLQKQLEKASVHVSQSQAATENQHVLATLELTL